MKKSIGAKTVLHPTPVLVVGTYDPSGRPNIMTAAWAGICCSVPPCVGVSLRKATYTYGNILAHQCFTVCIPSDRYVAEVDYIGMATGKSEDKFATARLTPVRSELINAPYVQEFPLVLECRLRHHFELGLHTQFVGEILDIKAETNVLNERGQTDIERTRPFLFEPDTQRYFGLGQFLGQAFSVGERLKS